MPTQTLRPLLVAAVIAAVAHTSSAQSIDFRLTQVPSGLIAPGLETRGGTVIQGINDSGQYVGMFGERNWTIWGVPHAFIHGSSDSGLIAYDPNGSGQSRSFPEGYRIGVIPGPVRPDPDYRYLDLFPSANWSDFNDRVTRPNDINNAGVVVGSISALDYLGRGPLQAFRYDSSTRAFGLLEVPGAVSSEATGVNNLGQIVGNFTAADGRQRGFLYSDGNYTVIERAGFTQFDTLLAGINDLGQIVGSSSGFVSSSFIYSAGSFSSFMVNKLYTVAADINNAGQIVGWVNPSGQRIGFVYDGVQATLLDLSAGDGSTYAYSINDLGMIAGTVDGSGFLATVIPIPEPATWALWLAGLLGVMGVARSRSRRQVLQTGQHLSIPLAG